MRSLFQHVFDLHDSSPLLEAIGANSAKGIIPSTPNTAPSISFSTSFYSSRIRKFWRFPSLRFSHLFLAPGAALTQYCLLFRVQLFLLIRRNLARARFHELAGKTTVRSPQNSHDLPISFFFFFFFVFLLQPVDSITQSLLF